MNSDSIIVGAGLALLAAWYLSKGKALAPTPTTPTAAAAASQPAQTIVDTSHVPYVLNSGIPAGGGDPIGNNFAPMLQPYGGGYDPFNTDFFNQTGYWAPTTYRQQYPMAPGVIDAAALEQ